VRDHFVQDFTLTVWLRSESGARKQAQTTEH
jgi:hypothetical protein